MKNNYGTKLKEALPNRRQILSKEEIGRWYLNIWTDRQITAVTQSGIPWNFMLFVRFPQFRRICTPSPNKIKASKIANMMTAPSFEFECLYRGLVIWGRPEMFFVSKDLLRNHT
jgi:hypothetical protein